MAEKAHTDQKFEKLFEVLCQMNNGYPTRIERKEIDKDSQSQLPATPPGISQYTRIKGRTKTWKTEEVQFDELTIPLRNRTQSAIRMLVKNNFGIDLGEVWV